MQHVWSWAQESINFKILLVWFCYTASLGNHCLIIHPLLIFQVEDQHPKKKEEAQRSQVLAELGLELMPWDFLATVSYVLQLGE